MATFYGTAGDYIEYCEARGYDVVGLSPSPSEEVEQELLVGSEYIDGVYRARFSGKRAQGRSQDREWPRIDATDAAGNVIAADEVPIEVIHATFEAARRNIENPGSLMPDYSATERVKREQVGPLAVEYATNTVVKAADAQPVFSQIDAILAPLIGSTRSSALFGTTARI